MEVSEGAGNRQETLERYRHLRAINKSHHSELTKHLPKKSFLTWGKRLGLIKGKKTLVANSISEVHLLNDIAIYSARLGKTTPVERYRRRAEFPVESDEAFVLDAMCNSKFAFIMIMRRHPVAGLIVSDLLRREEIWLMDEGLEETGQEGVVLASRLVNLYDFYMTTGVSVLLDEDLLEEIAGPFINFSGDGFLMEHKSPRFVELFYKAAIKRGVMQNIDFK